MSFEDEIFSGRLVDGRFPAPEADSGDELSSLISEADAAEAIDRQDAAGEQGAGAAFVPQRGKPVVYESLSEARARQEEERRRYREEELARVPGLIGEIVTREQLIPRPRRKIEGELGRKGSRRGL